MPVFRAQPLHVVRPLRAAGGDWQVVAHLTPVCRPPLAPGEFITGVAECSLLAGEVSARDGKLQADFRLDWVYQTGAPFRAPSPATCQQPIVLAANLPEGLCCAQQWRVDPHSAVQGAVAGPGRDDLRAALTLLVRSQPT